MQYLQKIRIYQQKKAPTCDAKKNACILNQPVVSGGQIADDGDVGMLIINKKNSCKTYDNGHAKPESFLSKIFA